MRILAVLSLAFGLAAFAGVPDVVACDDSKTSASSASTSQSEGQQVADVRPEGKDETTTERKADNESVAHKSKLPAAAPTASENERSGPRSPTIGGDRLHRRRTGPQVQ